MSSPNDAPGPRLLHLWKTLSPLPGGVWLFNRLVGFMVPYTGALGARLVALAPGHAVVVLRERNQVRNHLRSVHAIALANLAEFASGTAMLTALPPGVRGIVVRIEMDYLKKARGEVRATADVVVPEIEEPAQLLPEATITDAAGDVVARARVTWNVSPSLARRLGEPAAEGAAR